MTVWSLATQEMDDCEIGVSLYLTEADAYKALAFILQDEDDEDEELSIRLIEAIETLPWAGMVNCFDDELQRIGLIARVVRHDHPWTFGEAE